MTIEQNGQSQKPDNKTCPRRVIIDYFTRSKADVVVTLHQEYTPDVFWTNTFPKAWILSKRASVRNPTKQSPDVVFRWNPGNPHPRLRLYGTCHGTFLGRTLGYQNILGENKRYLTLSWEDNFYYIPLDAIRTIRRMIPPSRNG